MVVWGLQLPQSRGGTTGVSSRCRSWWQLHRWVKTLSTAFACCQMPVWQQKQ